MIFSFRNVRKNYFLYLQNINFNDRKYVIITFLTKQEARHSSVFFLSRNTNKPKKRDYINLKNY